VRARRTAFIFAALGSLAVLAYYYFYARSAPVQIRRRHKVVFLGDSYVSGAGDEENLGGFVGRVQSRFPELDVKNFGVPGADIEQYRYYLEVMARQKVDNPIKRALGGADVIVTLIGVNDYWQNMSEGRAAILIERFAAVLRDLFPEANCGPEIAGSTLIQFGDPPQQRWTGDLNRRLRELSWTKFRFDVLTAEELHISGKHPTASGYASMAKIVTDVLPSLLEQRKKRGCG
jgi:lysophospholipase L1-like esterase